MNFDKPIDRKNKGFVKWEKYKNTNILPMWVADMEFKSPPAIIEALQNKISEGLFGYSYAPYEAYQSVINYEKQKNNWQIEKDWIIFVPGLVSILYAITRIFATKDEEIITFVPIYPPFINAPEFNGRKLITVQLDKNEESYKIDYNLLEQSITTKTKILMLCNPQNPTGKVFSEEELIKISDIAKKYNLLIVSDEIHCDLILDENAKHIPISTISDYAKQNTITLQAPSKTYNIAGLNTAFVIIPDKSIRENFINGIGESIPLVNVLGYQALIAAYNKSELWRLKLIEYLKSNREIVYNFVKKHPLLNMIKPQATYLAWIDISKANLKNPVEHFEKFGIGLNDGKQFGLPNYVRLNFACPKNMLKEGLKRLDNALKNL